MPSVPIQFVEVAGVNYGVVVPLGEARAGLRITGIQRINGCNLHKRDETMGKSGHTGGPREVQRIRKGGKREEKKSGSGKHLERWGWLR